jgi:carbon-monoxide dehydrogenase large subunit
MNDGRGGSDILFVDRSLNRGTAKPWIGRPLRRVEDERLTRGRGQFVDDIPLDNCLHLIFLRSQAARGIIVRLGTDQAAASLGVVAVFSGADTRDCGAAGVNPLLPDMSAPPFSLLADKTVESVGQPVAAVIATSAALARDAADKIALDVKSVPPRKGEAQDHVFSHRWAAGDTQTPFASAAHTVVARVAHCRLAPSALEPRAAAACWSEADDMLTVWLSTQTPHRAREDLGRILHLDLHKIRVIAPDVGGAFGGKASIYPEEAVVAWAALRLKRNVRWCATRSEEFLASTQGRGAHLEGAMALDADGRILGLEARLAYPLGSWLPYSAAAPARNAGRILPGPYAVRDTSVGVSAHMTSTAAMNIYRGAGRPEAAMLMERLMERAAKACGLDPVEVRRRNLVQAHSMPYRTAAGEVLDSGDYPALLAEACKRADYYGLRRRQAALREEGVLFGVGVALYIEPCGQGWESAKIGLSSQGTLVVSTGSTAQGQGRETAFAQIAADALGVAFDAVAIRHGDTGTTPRGIGALASRSTAIGGSALLQAAEAFRRKAHQIAVGLLGCPETVVVPVAEGFVSLRTGRSVDWRSLAASQPPDAAGLSLTETTVFHAEGETWSAGCCIASVTIDADTGETRVESLTWVDDAGRIINPVLAKGQLIGGLAQGFGEAFLERIVYDDEGQLITGSFMDYAIPRADDVPAVRLGKLETAATANPLGAKGIGEAGCIGVPACLVNAVLDALSPLGIDDIELPMTSQAIWRALQMTKSSKDGALAP